MKHADLPASLRRLVDQVNTLLAEGGDEPRLLSGVGEAMSTLVARDDWLDPAFARPHPEHYQQYLLYADPDDRYSVVSFVWGPGQRTPIHDHTVWGVIGMLRGAELAQSYEITADGTPRPLGEEVRLEPGSVEFVSPSIGDVHKVSNALDDRVSISIHAYGANIGKVKRHVFRPEGGPPREFVSGYSNAVQ
jgi:predicted metal-dependent enzyme (double-stranded beta helix superfamily)